MLTWMWPGEGFTLGSSGPVYVCGDSRLQAGMTTWVLVFAAGPEDGS